MPAISATTAADGLDHNAITAAAAPPPPAAQASPPAPPPLSPSEDGSPASLDGDSPVINLYLTFDTPLPSIPAHLNTGPDLPPCPDLSRYVSPMQWHFARKAVLLVLSCIATFLTAYTAGAYSPPSRAMAHDFNSTNTVVLLGISSFCLGFALAPMALAPLSELWGRYPIFVIAGTLFMVFQGVCALVESVGGILVSRFLVGVGGSVFSAVVGGVISDLWSKEERNMPMAVFSGSVLLGTGAGPMVAAALIETLENDTLAWQWSFWHQMIMDGVLLLALVFLFRESRASVLLTRKAHALNRWYGQLEKHGVYGFHLAHLPGEGADPSALSSKASLSQLDEPKVVADGSGVPPSSQLRRIRWVVKEDESRPPLGKLMATSISRPFHLLFTEPIVFCFSLWAAFSWGVLFMSFAVVPYLYGDDFAMSSRVYIAMMAAAVVATVVGVCQEELLKHPQWRNHGDSGVPYSDSKFWAFMRRRFPAESPESRLYFACVTAMFLPAGLLGGFMAPHSMRGYAPAVGLGFANWGIYSVYLASFNYMADAYQIYASSALAAQSFCRNILGGAFGVITSMIFRDLGLIGAGGLLGGIAIILTLIPWVLMFLGPRIRARSGFAISGNVSMRWL
ncbi:putative MFS multidrug transporter [Stachybotrys elegans]|uniref:MFS multidrug transporter n=1 Tax=Stachybotrys elegans TaxID=80388 RepID=A0A8K0SWW5_9HYPO|nr:putative MFS multidrug transporter [Stachybotrys elegans]